MFQSSSWKQNSKRSLGIQGTNRHTFPPEEQLLNFIIVCACGTVRLRCQEVLLWSSLPFSHTSELFGTCLEMWKWGWYSVNSEIIMLKAHFIFFHLNMNYGDNHCFCREWGFFFSSLSFICLPLGKYSLIAYTIYFVEIRVYCSIREKNHFNNYLEQGEERKVFWRKIIPFPYFS